MRDERCARHAKVDPDEVIPGVIHLAGEFLAIAQASGHNQAGTSAAQVGRRERLNPQLSGKLASKSVELVSVAARDEDPPILQQIRRRVVQSGDGGGSQGLEALPCFGAGVVHHGREHGVASIAPALAALRRAIDDQHIAGGEEDHVAHSAALRERFHGPVRAVREGVHAAAGVAGGRHSARVTEGAGRRAATDEYLAGLEAPGGGEGEHDGAPRGGIVARLPGDGGVLRHDIVVLPVVEDGVAVGEDEKVVVREEVQERVEIVVLRVVRLRQSKQEGSGYRLFAGGKCSTKA